ERWQALASGEESPDGPLSLVAAYCQRIAERYGAVLLDLERRIDEIEDELFGGRGDALMQELVGYNTDLRKMRRILAYHVDVFARMGRHVAKRQLAETERFEDLNEIIERYHSLATLYQDLINDLIEGFISLNGHLLNQIMKVLTIVTVVFVPLSLLVGVYGMNFEHMPELKAEHGYYVLISVMAGIALGLLLLFRRMRWL
ncbi:MAG: CorA family divalent cation transporter, partial [Gammaproteobacteria bacterium]